MAEQPTGQSGYGQPTGQSGYGSSYADYGSGPPRIQQIHGYSDVGDPLLPPSDRMTVLAKEDRLNFILKVYGIVIAMLLVSFLVAAPFCIFPVDSTEFLEVNPWLLWVCVGLLVLQQLMHMCVMVGVCVGNRGCLDAYMKMFITAPVNYIYLLTYALVFGVVVGIIAMKFTASSVCLVYLLTAAILVALTVYAYATETDFTGLGPLVFVVLCGILLIVVVGIFVPLGEPAHRVLAGFVAITYGFIIVSHTQMIFGSAKLSKSRSPMLEYSIDMYAFAAFNLYLDFVNVFLQMLQALGERK